MKLGCCLNMLGNSTEPIGRNYIETAQRAGYDYVELPLAQVMELDEAEFAGLKEQLDRAGIVCEACNNFFPASVRITGENADPEKIRDYVRRAVGRAAALGAKVIVFGSSGAKNVPEGFSREEAFCQIVETLRIADEYTAPAGIRIVIEPLCRLESNIILNLRDGEQLIRLAKASSVRLLVDYYHFSMEKESLATLQELMPYIEHVHFAEPEGRRFPAEPKESYGRFFSVLTNAGYAGRVSVEAYAEDAKKELAAAVFLREYLR